MATFVRIAEAGSISKAARSLGLSVAMTSRHLSWLEAELGAPLMRRTTRRITLTDAGQELLVRARGLLAGVEEARQAVRPGRGVVGRVVVSAPVSLGLARVAPLVPALLEKHPRLHVDLRLEDRAVDLLADGVDVAIRAGARPPDVASLVARRLGSYPRVVCASPAFVRKHKKLDSVADLGAVPCVVRGAGPAEWVFETAHGAESVAVDGRLRTNSLLVVRSALLAGVGVAWLPLWLVADDLQAKRLVRVVDEAELPPIEVFALFHKQARGAAAIRAVLDELAGALGQRS
jgi:DNA-binding transcriptional LysR family regulator